MAILVAGGAGYIGSHTCVELMNAGYDIVVIDNLSNSCEEALKRVERICERNVRFYKADICDRSKLKDIFCQESIDAVINFAGLKSVGESVCFPMKYYNNNICGMLALCDVMSEFGVKNMIFSSSATVYGEPERIPVDENCPRGRITNPYGQTKAMIEQILYDIQTADPEWNIVVLRYFNPIGAHESGLIGESPKGIPNNLVPYIAQVASGRLERLGIYGDDYATPDGTGIRDYIHVVDLAKGHVKALKKLELASGFNVYNLGTGLGYSVLDVLHAYEKACGYKLQYEILPRRVGDIAVSYCDASKAWRELGWRAEKSLDDMCVDSWRWQSANPNGYM